MTSYEALREAADPAMKTPKPTNTSSHEPSTATQSQDLSKAPKSKTKSSTHLSITIRLGGRVAELPAGSKRRRGSGAGRRAGR